MSKSNTLTFEKAYFVLVLGFALSVLLMGVFVYFSNMQMINLLEQQSNNHEYYLNILNQTIKR